jgi:hypothetical protein
MFRAHRAHHQERQIVSIQPLVTVILCWRPRCVQVRRFLQIQGARMVTRSCFRSEDPHFWSDLRTSLLSGTFLLGACEPMHVFVYKGKTAVVVLKISRATLHNLDARATKQPEFVHPCAKT